MSGAVWEQHPLGDLGVMVRGVSYDPALDLRAARGVDTVDLLRANNVQKGVIVLEDVQHVHRRRVRSDQFLRNDDVLICAANGSKQLVGKAAQVRSIERGTTTFGAFMSTYRPDVKRVVPDYVAQHFHTKQYREWVELLLAGSSINNLRPTAIADFEIGLPGGDEQHLIAEALRDADALVDQLERLISKKRDIRQGVMQELLSERTRLPGFDDSWRSSPVSRLLEFKNGLNKASGFFGAGTPIVNFMDVMRSPVIRTADVKGRVTLTLDEVRRYSARRGDLFFTRTSETIEEVGTASVLIDDIPRASFSGFILRGRPKSPAIVPAFLAYMFQTDVVRRQVMATASYTTRALTNGHSLGRVEVPLPGKREQAAIVEILADLEAEIDTLHDRLESTRDLKQGMMQELLTGRTRLLVGEVAV